MRSIRYFIFVATIVFAGVLSGAQIAQARVEYALQNHIVSCNACHVSPFGGGPKNVNGKLYGSRLDQPGAYSYQDLISADLRAIAYYPERGTQSTQGTALMTSSVWGNVQVNKFSGGSDLRVVAGYSLGVVDSGPRDIYAMWESGPVEDDSTYIQFGRINVPFGMLTDEHRTYIKLLTNTEIFDYEMGAAISKDHKGGFHTDFVLANGERTGGAFNNNTPSTADMTAAGIFNARWMPSFLPLLVGTSVDYQSRRTPYKSPYAFDAYVALSLDRLSSQLLSGSILFEGMYGNHWLSDESLNPNLSLYFVPSANSSYYSLIQNGRQIAAYTQLNLNLSRRWVAQYKIDYLSLNTDFMADRFLRNGFGLKYYMNSNIILMSRYEFASVGRADISGSNVLAAENAFWIMGQIWF